MRHPPSETLLARLDDELSEPAAVKLARHFERCGQCRTHMAELDAARTALAATLARIDALEPDAWAEFDVLRKAGPRPAAADSQMPKTGARSVARRASADRVVPTRAWRWAALLLLAGAAGAAILELPLVPTGDAPDAAAGADSLHPPGGSVIAVKALDGVVDVVLTGVGRGTHIDIAFADADDVAIEVVDAQAPHFLARRGRIRLDLLERSATLRITYPRDMGRGTIRLDGRVIARIAGGAILERETGDGISIAPALNR